MTDSLLQYKDTLHVTAFGSALVILLLAEIFFKRRPFRFSRVIRIPSNLSLAILNNLLLHVSFPVLAMGTAVFVVNRKMGLFQVWDGPGWLELILGVLALDFIIYWQHIAFHKIPVLWRLHRVHHADLDLDVTSGIRFHPIEIFISMGIKMGSVLALGTPPLTVFTFELLLMLSSMFNHSNINLPLRLDRFLRLLIITPDVHRVHHSVHVDETNSNYGFNFPWWDRLFKTFRPQPRDGHVEMDIGIQLFRSEKWLYFHRLLMEPFINGSKKD